MFHLFSNYSCIIKRENIFLFGFKIQYIMFSVHVYCLFIPVFYEYLNSLLGQNIVYTSVSNNVFVFKCPAPGGLL